MSIVNELTKLNQRRIDLANNLITKGVTASTSETLTQLVPKVLDIPTDGGVPTDDFVVIQLTITTMDIE